MMKNFTTSIKLIEVSRDSIIWDIRTEVNGILEFATTCSDMHLYSALKIHSDLLKVKYKDPNIMFVNIHFYRRTVTPYILKSIKAREILEINYLKHRLMDHVLLGLEQYETNYE